jgi:type I restriction enzyme, S subunit
MSQSTESNVPAAGANIAGCVADASAGYFAQAASVSQNPVQGGVACPPGYKQTEVGVIPEDWNTPRFGEICTLINGRGFKPYEWSKEGLPIIRIQNLNGSDEFNHYQGYYDPKIFVQNGQLLFAWSGSRGTSFGPHIWSGGDALLNYHTWKLVVKEEGVDSGYFFHILKQLTKQIEDSAHGASALVHTQKGEMENFFVPLPSSKREQTAIANALSDVDALISELEKLIAKKQAIKTATMQQLLTGRTRLPQFALREDGTKKGTKPSELGEIPEDWQIQCLGDFIAALDAGVSVNSVDKTDAFPHGKHILKTSCVDRGNFIAGEKKSILPSDLLRAKCSPTKGAIIVSRMNTPALVGEIGYVTSDHPDLFLPDRLWQMRFKEGSSVNARWLSYVLSFPSNAKRIKDAATGTSGSMKNIAKSSLMGLEIAFPIYDEQAAIATILSDMDEEIQTLEQRLGKTRQIKQGMMQELLTGKTQLIQGKAND